MHVSRKEDGRCFVLFVIALAGLRKERVAPFLKWHHGVEAGSGREATLGDSLGRKSKVDCGVECGLMRALPASSNQAPIVAPQLLSAAPR